VQAGQTLAALGAMVAGLAVACSTPTPQTRAPEPVPAAAAAPIVDEPYVDRSSFTAAYRRLTETQYRNTIADIFGDKIQINARFEPERREEGLQAIGAAQLSITTTGLEQYLAVARSIADQVMESEDRDRLIGCTPGADADGCARTFVQQKGRLLFRRPLSQAEADKFAALAAAAGANDTGDFHGGLKLALVGLLMSPEFLFRVEKAEADPAAGFRLDAYSTASRVSFLLWDSAPDAELLDAARSGAILTPAGLGAQVDRSIASPRFERGARAFFTDMLQFDAFNSLTKDSLTYPKFSQAVADSSREETLRFLVDHLVTRAGDYRDIFTSRETFLNRTLAAVYNVPYASTEPWSRYTFSEESERAGILTQAAFLSLFSHPGSSSPTIRGVKLHEIFMCVRTPDPPPDVDFSKVQAVEQGTVRTRLIEHMTNPGCSTCHRISDPAGLTLERFDGLGQHRLLENGQPIDVSADIGGRKFSGAPGLGAYLRDSPLVPACLVRNVHLYNAGRPQGAGDAEFIEQKVKAFAAAGYRLPALLRSLLTDPYVYRVAEPPGDPPPAQSAAANGGQISFGDGR
jgi:hypothetical protein